MQPPLQQRNSRHSCTPLSHVPLLLAIVCSTAKLRKQVYNTANGKSKQPCDCMMTPPVLHAGICLRCMVPDPRAAAVLLCSCCIPGQHHPQPQGLQATQPALSSSLVVCTNRDHTSHITSRTASALAFLLHLLVPTCVPPILHHTQHLLATKLHNHANAQTLRQAVFAASTQAYDETAGELLYREAWGLRVCIGV